jgi:hypothetical protein
MRAAIVLGFAALTIGCSGGPSLSFSVRAGAPAASSTALTAGTGIDVSRVRLVIRKVELEKSGTAEMDEVASGPYLLDLDAAALNSGKVEQVLDVSFAPGTYSEIKLEVHKADSTDVGVNASLADMIAANASIIVDGTIDGAAFEFVSAVNAEQQYEGNLVLKDGSNLTLAVDPSTWFMSGGSRLDPTNEQNRSQIENNIQASLQAFQDDNHDGHDDDAAL